MKSELSEIEQRDKRWHTVNAAECIQQRFPYSQIERYKRNQHSQRYPLEWLFEKLVRKSDKNSVVLDFGCGDGTNTFLLSKCLNAKKVLAFDLSEELIRDGKIKSQDAQLENVEFLCSSFTNLPYEKESVDIVLIAQVLHHFPDHIPLALDVTYNLLREGGCILISEPICDSKMLLNLRKLFPKGNNTPDEAQLNSQELLQEIQKRFNVLDCGRFVLMARLGKFIQNTKAIRFFYAIDEIILRFKIISHFAADLTVLAVKNKKPNAANSNT